MIAEPTSPKPQAALPRRERIVSSLRTVVARLTEITAATEDDAT